MRADLHLHTTCSDGMLTPETVVQIANKLKLRAIAITDHDTIDGIAPALREAKKYSDLEVIPGIEINTHYEGQEIHILGYYIDYKEDYLKQTLTEFQEYRILRAKKIIYKLNNQLKIDVCFDEVLKKAKGPSVGRPHIAAALAEKGYAENIQDAFEKYLDLGKPAYVPRKKITPYDAIDIIKKSKGIPVLAHPGLLEKQDIIQSLIDYGIIGIEVIHRDHSQWQNKFYYDFALKNNLLMTGGSDSHGTDPITIGSLDIPAEFAYELKKKKDTII